MFFENVERNLLEASHDFDVKMMKVSAFFEAAMREAEIKYAEADMEYATESVGDYEYAAMYEEAGEKISERFVNAVKKLIEAIREFFAKIKEKIVALYRDSKISALVTKAKEKMRLNPFLKRQKVQEVPDVDAICEVYEEEQKQLNKDAAAASTDNFDEDEFDERRTKFEIQADKVEEAVMECTTSDLVNELDEGIKTMDRVSNEGRETTESIKSKSKKVGSDENKLLKVLKAIGSTVKAKVSAVIRAVTKIAKLVKWAVSTAIEKVKDGTVSDAINAAGVGAAEYTKRAHPKQYYAAKAAGKKARKNYESRRNARAAVAAMADEEVSESYYSADDYLDNIMESVINNKSYDDSDYDDLYESSYDSFEDDEFDVDSFLD